MCGFVGYEQATVVEYPEWIDALVEAPQLQFALKQWPDYNAYPAFGGDTSRRIPLLINENGEFKQVSAIWWFDTFSEDNITYIGKRTSFNARNLQSPFWKGALNKCRGLVLATQLGESKLVGKTKHQYLMQSKAPFMLGAIYKRLPNNDYACAIITRDAHPKMSPYHDKAFPLFLPFQNAFIDMWLGAANAQEPQIQSLLNEPILVPNLHVQRVKTYKHKQVIGNINATLISDLEQ